MQLMLTARQHDLDNLIEKQWRARIWLRQHPAARAKNVELKQLFKDSILVTRDADVITTTDLSWLTGSATTVYSKRRTKEKNVKLQKRLRADAEIELDELIKRVRNRITEIIDPARIMSADIVRLAFGNRTAAVRKKCVAQIVSRIEDELYAMRQTDTVSIDRNDD